LFGYFRTFVCKFLDFESIGTPYTNIITNFRCYTTFLKNKSLTKRKNISDSAKSTIKLESKAIAGLNNSINEDFVDGVETMLASEGRVVVTGIGKSALIAQKIVATLNSTGTPALFMYAADAIHGDLGMIQPDDVVLCISKSGETPEIKVLIPLIKKNGNILIAMVANKESYLATQAQYIFHTPVPQEACPNNLAPTTSTTAQLVLGDAIAICLLECRGFSSSDFAKFHPGGVLGKKLYLTVEDLYAKNPAPAVDHQDTIKNVILEISSKRLGAAVVLKNDQILGIITDGDLRRMLEKDTPLEQINAETIMSGKPKTIEPGMLVIDALHLMRSNNITQLVVTKKGKYLGMLHLHDILKEGII
jgi:arabinose-5-phosphate isomerase